MIRHIDTSALTLIEGELPVDQNAIAERVIDAALAAAYKELEAAGLGPCSGDVTPWEVPTLDLIGETLLRFAATNAAGMAGQLRQQDSGLTVAERIRRRRAARNALTG